MQGWQASKFFPLSLVWGLAKHPDFFLTAFSKCNGFLSRACLFRRAKKRAHSDTLPRCGRPATRRGGLDSLCQGSSQGSGKVSDVSDRGASQRTWEWEDENENGESGEVLSSSEHSEGTLLPAERAGRSHCGEVLSRETSPASELWIERNLLGASEAVAVPYREWRAGGPVGKLPGRLQIVHLGETPEQGVTREPLPPWKFPGRSEDGPTQQHETQIQCSTNATLPPEDLPGSFQALPAQHEDHGAHASWQEQEPLDSNGAVTEGASFGRSGEASLERQLAQLAMSSTCDRWPAEGTPRCRPSALREDKHERERMRTLHLSKGVSGNEVLVDYGPSGQLTRGDLAALCKLNEWTSDEVINCFLSLLQARSGAQDSNSLHAAGNGGRWLPRLHCFSSFFFAKLLSPRSGYDYAGVQRWTRKVDIFSCDLLLMPINRGNVHWTLVAVDVAARRIEYFDSMGGSCAGKEDANMVLSTVERYLRDEAASRGTATYVGVCWRKQAVTAGVPMQRDRSSCGIYMCTFADLLSQGCRPPFSFTDKDVASIRAGMVYALVQRSLGP